VSTADSDPRTAYAGVEELLARWLQERRAVLAKFTALVVGLEGELDESLLSELQQELCALLVDYVSAGHFEVYHKLLNEADAFGDDPALAARLFPAVGDTTEVILAYEEKYGADPQRRDRLKRDLSALGEVLESRFVLEDRLIAGLHGRHRERVEKTR